MDKRQSIDAVRKAHPVDAMLFGDMGAAAAHLCEDLSNAFIGKQFDFMDIGEFQALKTPAQDESDLLEGIYFRVHWAAALNIMRHQRWRASTLSAFDASCKLLGFRRELAGTT